MKGATRLAMRVVIADDEPLARERLRALSASTPSAAVREYETLRRQGFRISQDVLRAVLKQLGE